MTGPYKPVGHNSVSPYLVVADAAATIAFLQQALGGVELLRHEDGAGRVLHAEVRIDDSVVMLADAGNGWPQVAAHVHVYVKDVDASYRQALGAGGVPVQEPVKKEDADKRGGVKDSGGTTWWMATRVG